MKLTTATKITISGLCTAFALHLALFSWRSALARPTQFLWLGCTVLLYGSLIFFFVQICLKGRK